jgi:hypothetical protein
MQGEPTGGQDSDILDSSACGLNWSGAPRVVLPG